MSDLYNQPFYDQLVSRIAASILSTLNEADVLCILDASVRAEQFDKKRFGSSMYIQTRMQPGTSTHQYMQQYLPDLSERIRRKAKDYLRSGGFKFGSWPNDSHRNAGFEFVAGDIGGCLCSLVLCQPYVTMYSFKYQPESDSYV